MATEVRENTSEKALAPFKEMRDLLAPYPVSSYIQLLPTSAQERSDLFRPAITVVKVNPADPRDVYDTPGSGGKTVCLHSSALERIANAAGIDFDPTLTRHQHDRVHQPYICETHVGGWYTDSLGQRRPITAGAVSDLRDGTVTAKVLRGGLDVARQFICERTESRARNRAIRKTTNLPTSFTKDELTKPMVAVRFRLDERDPEARRALIAQGTRATSQVFGSEGPGIDAGVARPEEEIIEGQVTESPAATAEPEIPDDSPKAPVPVTDVADIARAIRDQADAAGDDRLRLATKEQLTDIGVGLLELLDLKGKLDGDQRMALRLSILRAIWPDLAGATHVSKAGAAIVAAMLKDPEGQRQLRLVAAAAMTS